MRTPSTLGDQVWDQVRRQITDPVWRKFWSQVSQNQNQIKAQVLGKVGDQVERVGIQVMRNLASSR